MSTQPTYDEPWGNVEPATEADIRDLIDHIVKAAVPRAGKTAVARIAKPLTDTLVAFRYTLLEDVGAGYAAWARVAKRITDGDRDGMTVEQIEQRVMSALDLLPPPVKLAEVGEVVSAIEAQDSQRIPIGAVIEEFRAPAPKRVGIRTGYGPDGFQWVGETLYRQPSADVYVISVGGTS